MPNEKPNYRTAGYKTDSAEKIILSSAVLRKKTENLQDKTFCFTNCSCDEEYKCDCNTECRCDTECKHCRCVSDCPTHCECDKESCTLDTTNCPIEWESLMDRCGLT